MSGDGFLLIGDAYAFVDPVFSSGVYLAMQSATKGADLVDQLLENNTPHKSLIPVLCPILSDYYVWFCCFLK
jgi:flavin-dependent dehydrogenase